LLLLPGGAPGLLIGLDYNSDEMSGPPFAVPAIARPGPARRILRLSVSKLAMA
jgi:hypothetical protein